jgi:hypothetical protein
MVAQRLLGLLLEEGDKVCNLFISDVFEMTDKLKACLPFLSLAFLRPPKAILVPGMYFLGFSRYSKRVFSSQWTARSLLASV